MMNKSTDKTTSETKQLVTFELEDGIYGMDIMVAQENLRYEDIRPVPNSPVYFEGFRNLRGKIIPIINFKKLFSFTKFDMEKQKYIIIIDIEGSNFGIVVDKVLRVVYYEEYEIKEVTSTDKEINNYIHGVIENNGELISILDMKAIFNYADKTLQIGSGDDDYVLKHKTKKNIYINFNQNTYNIIKKVMNRIGFPVNKTTEWSIKKFIAKITATKDLTLNTALNYIERKANDSDYYTNFNYKGKKIFFDVDEDYRAIQKIITNIIVPRKKENKNLNIRIWNIGCEDGIEAYSIAFLIKNYIDNYFSWNKIEIINSGFDYNKLKISKKAIYNKSDFVKFYVKNIEEFLETPEEKEIKELEELGDDIKINEEIRNMVSVDIRDVMNTPKIECDMVVARNFLTNQSEADVSKLVNIYSDSLSKNGILFLSEVESIEAYTNDFVLKEINNRPYFVKV